MRIALRCGWPGADEWLARTKDTAVAESALTPV
jgi:hypothetical protein